MNSVSIHGNIKVLNWWKEMEYPASEECYCIHFTLSHVENEYIIIRFT